MKDSMLYYSVGPLLYCPANNERISSAIINEKYGSHYSLALCLEDTINDNYVEEAEDILSKTISDIYNSKKEQDFFIPKIFIRVRTISQITYLLERFGESREIITGFTLPKFSLNNADDYIEAIQKVNNTYDQTIYMMPIFESSTIVNLRDRINILYTLKEKLQKVEQYVLNIRVGGNDLCHVFGFRRNYNESIHTLLPISNIFYDIITIFGLDYVVSGPVYEYYNGEDWKDGYIDELNHDRLCGFIGKTVIHPNQIPFVNEAYKVSKKDYDDAKSILNWNDDSHSLVSGSVSKERMNEYKTHSNWALKIIMLAETYGVK